MSFLTIVSILFAILLYTATCFYLGYNGWVWIKATPIHINKWLYIGIISFLSTSIILGQFITLQPLKFIGGLWMTVVGYSLILLPIANLIVIILKKKGILWIGSFILIFFLFVFVFGSFNAWSPVVTNYHINIEKKTESKDLKILMVSDLHLGQIVGVGHLQRLVNIVDEVQPDMVLIPGDIIDDYIEPFIENNMGETLAKITAPLGVYAIPGNHDYYGNDLEKMIEEVEAVGVQVLTDESLAVNDLFYLVGRNDLTDVNRKKVSELVEGLDKSKPIIMMDHQPIELDIAADRGIDILLSGHTHRGQLSPAHFFTDIIYENDWGYMQKGSLHSLVSSGFGTWGPPLRIGSRSEVVVINLTFGDN